MVRFFGDYRVTMPNSFEIAQNLIAENGWDVTPAYVQVFIVLSQPVRRAIYDLIESQEAALKIQRSSLQVLSKKGDVLGERIAIIQTAVDSALLPVRKALQIVPMDTLVNDFPALEDTAKSISDFLSNIVQATPLKIPALTAQIMGFGGFDFFEGVRDFKDLQNKLDDLEFRAARAASLSNYASTGLAYIDNLLSQITLYKDILNFLGT